MQLSPASSSHISSSPLENAIGAAEIAQLRLEFAEEGIGGLVEIFKQESPGVIAQMVAAIDRADADALRRAAHALKGGCGNFGARPIEALCQEMENAAQAGDVDGAARLLDPIRGELHRVVSALERSSLCHKHS